MRKWDSRSRRVLQEIHPDLRLVLGDAKQDSPVDFEAIEGLRQVERQRELLKSGASKTMNSRHLTGHAVDIMPRDPVTKKLVNGDTAEELKLFVEAAEAIKRAAKKRGVDIGWGKDLWDWDYYHFQLRWRSYPLEGQPAPKPSNSKTVKAASGAAVITSIGAAAPAISALSGIEFNWPLVTLVLGLAVIILLGFIVHERISKNEEYGI